MTWIQLTPAQKLALNAFLSLLAGAVVATLSAAYQYYSAGNVSISALLNFALLTFFVIFGKSLHDHVPSRARDAIQSAEETAQKAEETAQKAQETTQTIAASIAPVVQQNQETPEVLQAVSALQTPSVPQTSSVPRTPSVPQASPGPFVVIYMAPGSYLTSSALVPDHTDQVATETPG